MANNLLTFRQLANAVGQHQYIDLGNIILMSEDDLDKALVLTEKILNEPLLMSQLCDRVYDLMNKDLNEQKERLKGYGKLF